jgi:predicted outer membrane repeat protein
LGKGYTNFHITPQIINCNFSQNEATNSGGAINLAGGNNSLEDILVIENCIFQENNASFYGGAISLIELVNSIK